jgi:hypothetical protein
MATRCRRGRSCLRRVGRLAFLAAAASSLVVCLAAVGFWVRSYFAFDLMGRHEHHVLHQVGTARGALLLLSDRSDHLDLLIAGAPPFWDTQRGNPGELGPIARQLIPRSGTSIAGFFFGRADRDFGMVITVTLIPLWSVVLLTAILPWFATVLIARRRRTRGRLSAGCCSACGYDCRATPLRCPECGRQHTAAV